MKGEQYKHKYEKNYLRIQDYILVFRKKRKYLMLKIFIGCWWIQENNTSINTEK